MWGACYILKFKIGQGVLAKIPYKNGIGTPKLRPYLIVGINYESCKIKILNISTLQGKEVKLIYYKTNIRLHNYNPPFVKESFVKIDSCQEIDFGQAEKFKLLCGGKVLEESELNKILLRLKQYELECEK